MVKRVHISAFDAAGNPVRFAADSAHLAQRIAELHSFGYAEVIALDDDGLIQDVRLSRLPIVGMLRNYWWWLRCSRRVDDALFLGGPLAGLARRAPAGRRYWREFDAHEQATERCAPDNTDGGESPCAS